MLKIAIAQIDPVVGAFEANVRKISEMYERACSAQARLLLTPELGICGYPPHDLMDRPEIFDRNEKALAELTELTRGKSCALVVGHVERNSSKTGRSAQNTLSVLENGKRVFKQAKTLLPTYDVFDEARYFESASEVEVWTCDGLRIGMAVCEDLWAKYTVSGRHLYSRDPVEVYREKKAQLILAISSSPYEWGKRAVREKIHSEIARDLRVPLIYCNQVGATDEILFDGASFAFHADGKLAGRLPFFKKSFAVLTVKEGKGIAFDSPAELEDQTPEEIEILSRGLITGIQEYFKRTGFKKAILGLSGGIDSAVVGVLGVRALGAENVLGVAMPSQYSSSHSLEDAEILARNLGIRLEVRPIKFSFSMLSREMSERRGELASIALENLQSRLRGLILMTLSNHDGSLVLTTGNKSELATGYCTMYGDMVGALAPIGDLLKTRVYELARYLNKGTPVIPERSLTKAPSAELRPNQTDQDTLPPYDQLDALLEMYLERNASLSEISADLKQKHGSVPDWAKQTLKRLELNEYKRRQAAPVLKTSPKAFGIGRRIPIAKSWEQL